MAHQDRLRPLRHRRRRRSGGLRWLAAAGLLAALVLFALWWWEKPPANPGDLCAIFTEKRSWHRSARASFKSWGVPEAVQLAVVHQESRFHASARPGWRRVLWIFPVGRRSSAYGYGQVKDGTWSDYVRATGHRGAERDDFLGRECRDDEALLGRVQALLLQGDDEVTGAFSESRVRANREALESIADQGSTWMPERIGDFTILRRIGQGGMGVVYEAQQDSPRRTCWQ